ncbi:MAG: carboxypeptidase-like regulatory domain-containing protein, partial [Candidatus Thermoplasmatota archaeon]|nr:carboxypeptidase-like regulatory domain-containing protein [Candidatus Thermoplasmatota archaeon]
MNNGKVSILSKKKGMAMAIALIAIAGSFLYIMGDVEARTEPLLIKGTVYGTDGVTPVEGVNVTVRNEATGEEGTNKTDASGGYNITLGSPEWPEWHDGDLLVGIADADTQAGRNTTNIDEEFYNGTTGPYGPYGGGGYNWLNITLGTLNATSYIELGAPTYNISYGGVNYSAIKGCTPVWINASYSVEWLNYSVWWNGTAPDDYMLLYTFSIYDNDENDGDNRTGHISAELHFLEECFHEIKWDVVEYDGDHSVQKSIDIAVDTTVPAIEKT